MSNPDSTTSQTTPTTPDLSRFTPAYLRGDYYDGQGHVYAVREHYRRQRFAELVAELAACDPPVLDQIAIVATDATILRAAHVAGRAVAQ